MTLLQRARATCGRLRRRIAPGGLILMYHRVVTLPTDPWNLTVSPEHFAEHLDVVKRLARPTTLERLASRIARHQRPHKDIAITFDDGYADNLRYAKPALERADLPATVFVVSGHVGAEKEFWWDELERILLQPGRLPARLDVTLPDGACIADLGDAALFTEDDVVKHRDWQAYRTEEPTPRHALYRRLWSRLQSMTGPARETALATLRDWAGDEGQPRSTHRTMTRAEIAILAAGGLIEIGAHTATHAKLNTLPPAEQRDEIARGKRELEAVTGAPLHSFAYPHGLYSDDTPRLVRESGFQSACTTWPSTVWRRSDPFLLPRFMAQNWDGEEFARRLTDWLRTS
ncbi:MAG TPA: polysaccharide deacetylase family protein [Nitrospirales bacterium]|nr:polysaccharide deacetylase family protein [Nitrospirales bacterium]